MDSINRLKCKICGAEFQPTDMLHYISEDLGSTNPKEYDAFDCPICGCQINVQERKRFATLPLICYDSAAFGNPFCEDNFEDYVLHMNIGDRITTTMKTGEEVVFTVVDKLDNYVMFGLEDCLDTLFPMNDFDNSGKEWAATKMRKVLDTTIYNQLPDDIRVRIKPREIDGEGYKLWLFSKEEVFSENCFPYFKRRGNRIKGYGKDGGAGHWWLRSKQNGYKNQFDIVVDRGIDDTLLDTVPGGVVFGFVI